MDFKCHMESSAKILRHTNNLSEYLAVYLAFPTWSVVWLKHSAILCYLFFLSAHEVALNIIELNKHSVYIKTTQKFDLVLEILASLYVTLAFLSGE